MTIRQITHVNPTYQDEPLSTPVPRAALDSSHPSAVALHRQSLTIAA